MDSNHCPRAYKARALPTELRYHAFAGTLDLHYYRASTMLVIMPTLNPAKFISEIGVLPLGTPPCFRLIVHGGYRAP